MYSRNRIYISSDEQKKMRDFHILLAGAGLGSVIAECALRMGFEKITIIDGDVVEESNLNRQNYTQQDIGMPKAEVLKKRLLSINSNAKITAHHQYLTNDNIEFLVQGIDVAINAIDFTSEVPFEFDQACVKQNIPALHPYNLGWASCVFVVNKRSENLTYISNDPDRFELKFVDYIIKQLTLEGYNAQWLSQVVQTYKNEAIIQSPPQLAVASWIVAGLCADILFRLVTGKQVKLLPDFYFKTI